MRKLLVFVSLIACLLFMNSLAFAQAGWGNFYVKAAGQYHAGDLVKLEPVTGGEASYFIVSEGQANKILATSLTAISTGKPVRALIGKVADTGHWSDYMIRVMFIGDAVEDLT